MLERLVVTLTVSTLSVTLGGTYAWAQGAFTSDVSPVAQHGAPVPDDVDVAQTGGFGSSEPRATPGAGRATEVDGPGATGAGDATRTTGTTGTAPWDPVAPVLPVGGATSWPSSTWTAPLSSTDDVTTPADTGSETGSETGTDTGSETGDAGTGTGGTGTDTDEPGTPSTSPTGAAAFRVVSLNVLGSSHTRPGGQRPTYAAGTSRIVGAVDLLRRSGASVAGLQELQADQAAELVRLTPGWETYPGTLPLPRSGPESLTWDRSVWKAVEKHLVDIPFMDGQERQMPYVLLEHRATGSRVWFSNVHFAPGNRGTGSRWRAVATDRQVALVNRLAATGHEQVVTGDMNEVERYFCRITGETPLRSAEGGSHGDGQCRPPAGARIDWILGTPGLRMTGFERRRDASTRAVTDHPMLLADVTTG